MPTAEVLISGPLFTMQQTLTVLKWSEFSLKTRELQITNLQMIELHYILPHWGVTPIARWYWSNEEPVSTYKTCTCALHCTTPLSTATMRLSTYFCNSHQSMSSFETIATCEHSRSHLTLKHGRSSRSTQNDWTLTWKSQAVDTAEQFSEDRSGQLTESPLSRNWWIDTQTWINF